MQFLGVDTGGTFTDFVFYNGKNFKIHKVLSTPNDPPAAILIGTNYFHDLLLRDVKLIHGTTVATNALLERKGAKVLLLTTKGFEDVLEIGRQNRDELYDLFIEKSAQLVVKENRIGIDERINSSGQIIKKINIHEIHNSLNNIDFTNIDTIAVCFINSYVNPIHEIEVQEFLKNLNIPVSISSNVIQEFREYERTSTTVANSYLIPKVKNYMESLNKELDEVNIYVMQSNGGVISPSQAGKEPVRIITSGPAGGVVGAFKIAQQIGIDKIITYDMGGTSTDISLCEDSIKFTTESVIDGIPIKTPMIDIFTIGAGGGSIAYIDAGGVLKVGPQSAGADPGPACYGKGKEPTVTDANLLLGRIQAENFLGGRMQVNTKLSHDSINKLKNIIGIDKYKVAETIIRIANSNMEKAIRVISVDKGYDPREFTLISFGGAGGLHACDIAREIGIKKVVFPINPGVLSALGMLFADSFKDYSKGFFLDYKDFDFEILEDRFKMLEERAREEFKYEELEFEKFIDTRYKNQSYELTVKYGPKFINDFHELHLNRYGFNNLQKAVEIVTLRLRAVISRSNLLLPKLRLKKLKVEKNEIKVFINNKIKSIDCLNRNQFYPGFNFNGPSIITEDTSTIYIPDGFKNQVDEYGNILSKQV